MADDTSAPPAIAEPVSAPSTTTSTENASSLIKPAQSQSVFNGLAVAPAITSFTDSVPSSGPPTPKDPVELKKSQRVSIADLSARATAQYARREYEEAAETYAQAAEMQAEVNGEMNPDNAEILFLYGRAVFKVGQSKSDVLGGRAPDDAGAQKKGKKKLVGKAEGETQNEAEATREGAAASSAEGEADKLAEAKIAIGAASDVKVPNKALFQFQGDENLELSGEDEEAEDEGDVGEDDESDDLSTAFEALDLARVLFERRLEMASEDGHDKGKAAASDQEDPTIRHIKERLGDTHDLLNEIQLENERYADAIKDARAALKYKLEVWPQESEVIAEAYYKLSLALEFASVTTSAGHGTDGQANGNANEEKEVDEALRSEAAEALEQAIASTRLKLQNKEVELATLHNPEDNENTRRIIVDVKEMLADMEQRLKDLKKPHIDLADVLGLPQSGSASSLVNNAASTAARLEKEQNATDLAAAGLVRKKRKAEDVGMEDVGESDVASDAKKTKVEAVQGPEGSNGAFSETK